MDCCVSRRKSRRQAGLCAINEGGLTGFRTVRCAADWCRAAPEAVNGGSAGGAQVAAPKGHLAPQQHLRAAAAGVPHNLHLDWAL